MSQEHTHGTILDESDDRLDYWREQAKTIPGRLVPIEEEARMEEIRRIDGNFVRIDKAIAELAQALKKNPPRPRRSGRAAEVDADDIRVGRIIIGLTAVFAIATFAASFSGQYAMATHTAMPPYLWVLVPLFIELPIAYSQFTAMVFRRRGKSAAISWALMIVLTLIASIVNVAHVLSVAGLIDGLAVNTDAMTLEILIGASIMGLVPILLLISFEEMARLLIKKPHERKTEAPAPATPNRRKKK